MFVVSGVTGAIVGPGGRALALEVVDEEGRLSDTMTVVVDDRDGEVAMPARGQQLSVSMGYRETGVVFMGTYIVDEVTLAGWPQQMEVTAHAVDMQGTMKQGRTQDYQHKSVNQIVQEVASRNGLTAGVSGSAGAFQYEHLAQTEESDMHFITRLAQKHGAIGKVANGMLLFSKKGEPLSVGGRSMSGAVARVPDNVLEYRATFQGRSDYQGSVGGWWDKEAAERIEQMTSGQGGGQAVGQAIFKLLPMYADGEQEAQEASQSRSDVNAIDTSELHITIIGDPGASAGAPLQVSGIRSDVDGTWMMTKVTHHIDSEGYVTIIEAKGKQ
jgi:phage protein D